MSAAEQPLSTLSADADTASYANLRRLVRSGAGLGTIDPGAVRIEEMLNYFDYDYAAPAEGEDFALTARAGACPWNAESELVVLGLTVGQAATEAPPTNLVLLVDVSGSMGDAEKLQVEFDPRMVESYRLIGYANRVMADDDFRNDAADAGELCAGAELTVAYEVVLTDEGRRREGDESWLTCAVRYQPAGERAGEAPAEQRFAVGRESWSAEPGDDWSLAAAVVEFGMLARDSEFVGTATADDAAALAESSASSLDATDRAARRELTDLIRQAQRNAAFDGVVAAS